MNFGENGGENATESQFEKQEEQDLILRDQMYTARGKGKMPRDKVKATHLFSCSDGGRKGQTYSKSVGEIGQEIKEEKKRRFITSRGFVASYLLPKSPRYFLMFLKAYVPEV